MKMRCFGFCWFLIILKVGFRCAGLSEQGGCLLLKDAFDHKRWTLLRSVDEDLDLGFSIFEMASSEANEQIPPHPSVDHTL